MRRPAILAFLLLGLLPMIALGQDVAEPTLSNAHRPEEGLLFGGQPTEAELTALAAAGYTVLEHRASAGGFRGRRGGHRP
jgi:hypothetical protein